MTTRKIPLLLALCVGCGPLVSTEADETGSESDDASSGTGVGSTSSSMTASPVTTSPATTMTTAPVTTSPVTTSPATTSPVTTMPSTVTTSPPTSATESSSSSGFESIGFIRDPDGGSCAPAQDGTMAHCSACSVWDQDCARGERCNIWANDGGDDWNATRCVELDPTPSQLGDACTVEGSAVSGIDNCDIGLVCLHADQSLEGACVEYCLGTANDPSCSDPQTECVVTNEGALPACLRTCDPLLQACPDGQGCYGIGVPGEDAPTSCLRPGEGVHSLGLLPAACPVGTTDIPDDLRDECMNAMETCCASWCSTDEVDACGAGLSCLPWGIGDSDLGVCVSE